jgi:aminoglycoside phosphotransferase (APT) family kinase protein
VVVAVGLEEGRRRPAMSSELRVAGGLGQRLVQWCPGTGVVVMMKTASGSALASVAQISDSGRAGVQRRKQQHSKASSKQVANRQHWCEASSGTAKAWSGSSKWQQASWRPSQGQQC